VELTPEILFVGDWADSPLTDVARSETGQSGKVQTMARSETGHSNGDRSETGQGRPDSEVKA
jgi:hypothetical protein